MGTVRTSRAVALLILCGCGPGVSSDDDGRGTGTGSASSSTTTSTTTTTSPSTTVMPLTTAVDDTSGGGTDDASDTMSLPPIDGRWTCTSTFEDPLYVTINTETGVITGQACGPTLDMPEDPFASLNCGELFHVVELGEVQFQFTLPYPDFPEVGPVDFEFIGDYDPAADELGGVLWTSTLMMPVPESCRRA